MQYLVSAFITILTTSMVVIIVMPYQGEVAEAVRSSRSLATSLYHYDPSLGLTGSNYIVIGSNSSLQLSKFTVAAWFRTNMDVHKNFTAFIVNKGGLGEDTPTNNLNYGVWMENGSIVAGFETKNGTDFFVTSPLRAYNDSQWHYVVSTSDGSIVNLYIDGEQVANKYTNGAIPDNTGKQPVRIGANSYALNNFFTGNIDEIRIWNRALTFFEISDLYIGRQPNMTGQVLYVPFITTTKLLPAQCDQSLWNHVYNPNRLEIISPCKTVSGVIAGMEDEIDGDLHLLLRLDQRFSTLLNSGNKDHTSNLLMLEPICQARITDRDVGSACMNFIQGMNAPQVSSHVNVTGSYVLDTNHFNWAEIHPVTSMISTP